MPVPLNVMQAAAQGDKQAMRLVEKEYGVGNGQNYALDWLSEEEPPPSKSTIQTIELLKNNSSVPFVDRILRPDLYPVRKNPDNTVSTHLMAYGEQDGKYFVYPTLQYIDKTWVEDENPNSALKRNNVIYFDREEDAKEFALGSWKKGI